MSEMVACLSYVRRTFGEPSSETGLRPVLYIPDQEV